MVASDEEIRKIRAEREAKDPRYRLAEGWDRTSTLRGLRSNIEDRGYCLSNNARVYPAELALILCSDSLPVLRFSDKQLVQISGFSYLDSYLSGYRRGCEEFEREQAVSANTLYGPNAQSYISNLHNLYYHSEAGRPEVAEGWHFWKIHFDPIVSHANIERQGYYAGLMSCVDELSEKHPALFREFHSCKIQPEPISSPNATQMTTIPAKEHLQNLITQGLIAKAIDFMLELTKNSDLHNDIIHLSARHHQYERNKMGNLAENRELKVDLSSIIHALQYYIDQLPPHLATKPVPVSVPPTTSQIHHGSGDNVAGDKINIGRQIIMERSSTYIENQGQPENKTKSPVIEPIKILFLAAQPIDQHRLQSEFDTIRQKVKSSIDQGDLNFLPPTWDTDYDRLLTRLKEDKPHVVHYSGHGGANGINLVNLADRSTQLLENKELTDVFGRRSAYLRLVLLNSCFSISQAKIISEQGLYVLGIREEKIEDTDAQNLAERFYLGFTTQDAPISIEVAIHRGCTNFAKTYPAKAGYISLWKDGKEIDYKTL